MCEKCERFQEFVKAYKPPETLSSVRAAFIAALVDDLGPVPAAFLNAQMQQFMEAHGTAGSAIRTAFNNLLSEIDQYHASVEADFLAAESAREAMLKD